MGQPPDMGRLMEWSMGNYVCCMPGLEGRQCVQALTSEPASAHHCFPPEVGPGLPSVLTASPQNVSNLQHAEDIWDGIE